MLLGWMFFGCYSHAVLFIFTSLVLFVAPAMYYVSVGFSYWFIRLRQDHTHVSSVGTTIPTEINLDDLPPDTADPKRISQYTNNPKK